MRANPRGAIVRTMRLTEHDTDDTGAKFTRIVSAPGIIVRLAHIAGRKPSDVRRDMTRFCRSRGIIPTPCEFSGGQFSPRTGKPIPGSEPQPTAYQCIGAPDALAELAEHFTVAEWSFALNIKAPMMAQGSGPEKVRSSLGSAFGKPETTSATATQLAKQASERIRADRKAWGTTTAE